MISPHPATQQAPIPRATTAACDVRPPRTVNIPCAAAIPSISSGVVSRRTKTTLSPFPPFPSSFASSAVNTTLPAPAPGAAFKPVPITLACFRADGSNTGCSN